MVDGIIIIYTLLLFLLLIYAGHAYLMIYHYIKNRRKSYCKKSKPQSQKSFEDLPFVTFQLPIYNEKYVIRRLLESCCTVDYPKDKFEIQILDDSDDETVTITSNLVRNYCGMGFNVHHIRRGTRCGFKAGALQHGLASARGDLIAVFDADFVVPKNFLIDLIDEFDDPNVAVAQARWGHLNSNYSLFTMAQAITLDGHFVIEQFIRSREQYFINFNGTCGIWRKSAIIDAGGWHADTLAEDMDLSYRAQLKNWKIVFRPDVNVKGELPADIASYRTQQNRWAKGTIQVARKILPKLLKADLPLPVKYESFVHLTCHLIYPALFAIALLSLPIVFFKIEYIVPSAYFIFASCFTIGFFGYPIYYSLSQRELYPHWRKNIIKIPFIIALCTGVSLSNAIAVFKGLFSNEAVFVRTPKYGFSQNTKNRVDRFYAEINTPFISYVEVLCGLYLFFSFIYTLVNEQLVLVPFFLLYSCGFFYLGLSSMKEFVETKDEASEALEAWYQKNS